MKFIDFPLDRRRLLYINVLMGQWERVERVAVMSPSVCSKPVAEFRTSGFFLEKLFRFVSNYKVIKEIAAELDRSAGQWSDAYRHF